MPTRLSSAGGFMKLTKSVGMLLLGVWLIVTGLVPLLHIAANLGLAMSVLAVVAGALILIGR